MAGDAGRHRGRGHDHRHHHLLNNGVQIFPARLRAIREAKHTIDFAVYIWEPGQACAEVSAALIERARAGVQVRVLLDGMGALKVPGDTVDAMMMHTKGVVVDGKWSIVGSPNMDIRSKELNMENVLGILDAGFGAEMESTFRTDLQKAREIRLEEWRRRGRWQRFRERACALFAEQY